MATSRRCSGTITDVYEILGDTQVEVYEEALRIVTEEYDPDVTFDIQTSIDETFDGMLVTGQLNVYR